MQRLTEDPLLAGSVLDETQHRIVLSNGSEIRSVPASERQVRGWSVDLLLIDEAAFVDADLILSAALPTTAARPDARIVLASSPWGDSGPFRTLAEAGQDPANQHTVTYQWKLSYAWWISEGVIEAARATMSDLRFRAEYLGEWAPAGDAYFNADDLRAAVADYPLTRDGGGASAYAGLDWGRRRDAHAVAVAALCDDYGINDTPVIVLPWAETSRRRYAEQIGDIEDLASRWNLTIKSETNGVGAYPTESLEKRLPHARITAAATTQRSKEDAYGRLTAMLAEQTIALPNHAELLRQLAGVSASPTPSGGLRIAARSESIHDDLPDALTSALSLLPDRLSAPERRDPPDCQEWAESPGGLRIPVPLRFTAAEVSYANIYGDIEHCGNCGGPRLKSSPRCPHCTRHGDTMNSTTLTRPIPVQ